ncbi:MAG: hypothetical protein AAGI30_00800 [Planctomycetota bacterium]
MSHPRTLVACVLAAGVFGLPAQSQNLLSNPSFETVLPPLAGGGPANWFRFNGMQPSTDEFFGPAFDGMATIVSEGEFLGDESQSDNGLIQNTSVSGASGRCFRCSVYARSTSLNPIQPSNLDVPGSRGHFPLVIMDFTNSSGNVIDGFSVGTQVFEAADDPVDQWLRTSVQAVAPEGTEGITAFLLFIQFDNSVGQMLWDLVELVEVDTLLCPPDWDDDGDLDGDDVSGFLVDTDFDGDAPAVDYNCDTLFDAFDVAVFLDDVFVGCPL